MTVIVVDDDPNYSPTLADLLQEMGYRVVTADRCSTAIEWARKIQPDAAIVDYYLHRRDGIQTVAELRRVAPGLKKVLLYSGFAGSEILPRAKDIGVDAFVPKPADPLKILDILESLISEVPGESPDEPGGIEGPVH